MILKQFYLGCLAHASYFIGDEKSKVAAVVDPQRDVDQYAAEAAERGFTIRHALLTHFHADFVAGHMELRERFGAKIHVGARATAEFEFEPMRDGGTLDMGDVRLAFLETPGHTPEGVTILVYDLARDPAKPHAALTGDTLFIGDVGRPDLMASVGVSARELGGMLYRSIHEKILPLPDETLVYPAHGAGSMCGKNLSTDTVSTIGAQRKTNYALQPMSEEEFVAIVTANQPKTPGYFAHDATLNRQERATLDETLAKALVPLSLEDALRAANTGAILLDVREPDAFAAGHIAGSQNIGLSGKFATWAGTVLGKETAIVLVADPGREQEAAVRLGRIGFDRVLGFVAGGATAAGDNPEIVRRWERVTPARLAEEAASAEPPLTLDVREPSERVPEDPEASLAIPLNQLEQRLSEIPREGRLVVMCASGYRSSVAASLLARHGYRDLADLAGGAAAWRKSAGSKA